MAQLTLVVAVDAQNGIGVDNQLPWHLPEDLAHFKRVTLGKPIIMGRKTFDSIGRPLPKRRNIVVTRNLEWHHEGVETAPSLEAAVALLAGEPASIIGGAQIFRESMDIADAMIVTHIDRVYRCDTFFPAIDPEVWVETERETHHSDADGVDYAFVTYVRKER
ncbi:MULTISPECIES: dihydrofolate reductase [unclassified Massilia]|uniref:dihydrofolate reductase n=1 Tax=unclassified Massilia TaxID=2609279 RepID=UPI001B83F8BD|nr:MULTISPECIES: dihydrofolate reductase [unclassified Massilia]MBQ5938451.1 dihydrofolate reductase [Massilia sp. AB1]MBQ5963241.1 dihydrofolate reductase [Massilia sp. ZL223]